MQFKWLTIVESKMINRINETRGWERARAGHMDLSYQLSTVPQTSCGQCVNYDGDVQRYNEEGSTKDHLRPYFRGLKVQASAK